MSFVIEGESGAFYGGARAQEVDNGVVVAAFLNAQGRGVRHSDVPAAQSLTVRYASAVPNKDGRLGLYVNNVRTTLALPHTGNWYADYRDAVFRIDIPAGATLDIRFDAGDTAANIDYLVLSADTAPPATGGGTPPPTEPEPNPVVTKIEGEAGAFYGGAKAQEVDNGVVVAAFLNAQGKGVRFSNLPATQSLTVRYASAVPNKDGRLGLYVNDVRTTLALPYTGNWYADYRDAVFRIDIPAGATLDIRFDAGDTAANIDYLVLSADTAPPATGGGTPPPTEPEPNPVVTKIEGEAGAFYGGAKAQEVDNGVVVAAFLNAQGKGVRFSNLPATQSLTVRYASAVPNRDGQLGLYVNDGGQRTTLKLPFTGNWYADYRDAGFRVDIPAGATLEIRFDAGDTAANIDYLLLSTGATPPESPPAAGGQGGGTPTPTEPPPSGGGGTINTIDTAASDMDGATDTTKPYRLYNEAYLHGAPNHDFTYKPVIHSGNSPRSGWMSMTMWGQLYGSAASPTGPYEAFPSNTRIQLRNVHAYVLSRLDRRWHLVQTSALTAGGFFLEDFANNGSLAANERSEASGGISVKLVQGRNYHFWPGVRHADGTVGGAARATFNQTSLGSSFNPQTDILGVFTTFQARLIVDNANAASDIDRCKVLGQSGADYWRSADAQFASDWSNNGAVMVGKAKYIGRQWRAFNAHTMTAAAIRANSPPLE